MKNCLYKRVIAVLLIAVTILNLSAGDLGPVRVQASNRPEVNTDTKHDYREDKGNSSGGDYSGSGGNGASGMRQNDKGKTKSWNNEKKHGKKEQADNSNGSKKHKGIFGSIQDFVHHAAKGLVRDLVNMCSNFAGKVLKNSGEFLKHNTKACLGGFQLIGGVLQFGVGLGLCSTGAGAILGVPLMMHGAADMLQGGSIYINAKAGKQVLPEVNFMEEGYKAVGGMIGRLIGGKKGKEIGRKIATGTFTVVDLGLGLVSAEGALKLGTKLKSVDTVADVFKVYGKAFATGMADIGKMVAKAGKALPDLFKAIGKKTKGLAGNISEWGKVVAKVWKSQPKNTTVAVSCGGVGELEKVFNKMLQVGKESSEYIKEGTKLGDEVAEAHKVDGGVKGVTNPNKSYSGSREIFLDTASSHDSARKILINELDSTGAFKNGSSSYQGRLKSSYGYKKQIGRQSLDGKVRWRLDFDDKIGVHYNIEDFSKGKGKDAVKKVISIDITEKEYKKIIDLWNK